MIEDGEVPGGVFCSELALSRNSSASRLQGIEYDPFTRRLTRGAKQSPGGNALFVRDRSFVQERLTGADKVQVLNRWL